MLEKSGDDSDLTVHEHNESVMYRFSGKDDGDDTSNEEIPVSKKKELTEEPTAALKRDVRAILKRMAKYEGWLSSLSPREDIHYSCHESFVQHKFRTKMTNRKWTKVLETFEEDLVSCHMQLNAMYGDEICNHVMHISSLLQCETESPAWIEKEWFKTNVTDKWVALAPRRNKRIKMKTRTLPDKSEMFHNYYGKPQILKMVYDHCLSECDRILALLKNQTKYDEIEISIYGLERVVQESIFYWKKGMVSHVPSKNCKDLEVRPLYIGENVQTFFNRCYNNGNSLSYIMLFDAMDSNEKLHKFITNGIDDKMDVKLKISKFVSQTDNQRGIIEHYLMSQLKFVIWYRVHQTGINGSWAWPLTTIHLPWQDIISVIKLLSDAIYHYEASQSIDTPLPKSNPQQTPLQFATADKRKEFKRNQCLQFLFTNSCNPQQPSSRLLEGIIAHNITNKFNVLPLSTANSIFNYNNIKSKGSKLSYVRFRGRLDVPNWKVQQKTMHLHKGSTAFAKLHIPDDEIENDKVPTLIGSTLDEIESNFGVYGEFDTNLPEEICNEQFCSYKFVNPAKPWLNINAAAIFQVLFDLIWYYGDNWRCHNGKQWHQCNSSLQFKTVAKILNDDPNFNAFVIVDFGMNTNGQAWDAQDTCSDSEAILTQKDGAKQHGTHLENTNFQEMSKQHTENVPDLVAESIAKRKYKIQGNVNKLPNRPISTQAILDSYNDENNNDNEYDAEGDDDENDNDNEYQSDSDVAHNNNLMLSVEEDDDDDFVGANNVDNDDDDDDDDDDDNDVNIISNKSGQSPGYVATRDYEDDEGLQLKKERTLKQVNRMKQSQKMRQFQNNDSSSSDQNDNKATKSTDNNWCSTPSKQGNKQQSKYVMSSQQVRVEDGKISGQISSTKARKKQPRRKTQAKKTPRAGTAAERQRLKALQPKQISNQIPNKSISKSKSSRRGRGTNKNKSTSKSNSSNNSGKSKSTTRRTSTNKSGQKRPKQRRVPPGKRRKVSITVLKEQDEDSTGLTPYIESSSSGASFKRY